MPVVQCPSCQKSLNLKQIPAGGRFKCPSCGGVVSVGSGGKAAPPAGAKRPAAAQRSRAPLTPNDDGFDFGQIRFPSAGPAAVSQYPVDDQKMNVYTGPIQGDPMADQLAAEGGGDIDVPMPGDTVAGKSQKGKLSPAMLAGIIGGVVVLMLLAIVIGTLASGGGEDTTADAGGNAGPSAASRVAEVKKNVPEGYQLVELDGVVAYLPKGETNKVDGWKSRLDTKATESNVTGSFFLFGVMDAASADMDKEKIRKAIGKQFTADYLGGQAVSRNGYDGIKGMITESLFVPRMQCETFLVGGRLVVMGVARASDGGAPGASYDRGAEQKEVDTFQQSMAVGPKSSSGWFGN